MVIVHVQMHFCNRKKEMKFGVVVADSVIQLIRFHSFHFVAHFILVFYFRCSCDWNRDWLMGFVVVFVCSFWCDKNKLDFCERRQRRWRRRRPTTMTSNERWSSRLLNSGANVVQMCNMHSLYIRWENVENLIVLDNYNLIWFVIFFADGFTWIDLASHIGTEPSYRITFSATNCIHFSSLCCCWISYVRMSTMRANRVWRQKRQN